MKIPGKGPLVVFLLCSSSALVGADKVTPDSWIPARWPGGQLELARRAKTETPPADAPVRETIANWYDAATLDLLKGSPVNCLLVDWSAGADVELEGQQQRIVKAYASEAHKRGIAILGGV